MELKELNLHELNLLNQKRYAVTAWFYDILDYPWELQYRKWRPGLLADVSGEVLEAGIGTGRNLKHYQSVVNLTAVDFQSRHADARIEAMHGDVLYRPVRP